MRVLIVKTSSMGDVIHTLPALTDAGHAIRGISFDWVAEENFAEIPAWHPLVNKIIPVAWRRWRKNLFSKNVRAEMLAFIKNLRAEKYDLIIDAQGLVKSAVFSRLARGLHCGLNWQSAREKFAALFYRRTFNVLFEQHAVVRARSLFSQILKYPVPDGMPDYGINREQFINEDSRQNPYLVFLHGTTWITKHWPEEYWIELAKHANNAGYNVKLPWGNPAEYERAQRIAAICDRVDVLPRLDLVGMANVLAGAKAIASVDTGLGHLAAALDVPTVSLYGPTNPEFTGALGKSQVHLAVKFPCAPCYSKVCTYAGVGAENGVSSLRSLSPLYPQCFLSLDAKFVWDALEVLL
jgi:heptosyltransferase-1